MLKWPGFGYEMLLYYAPLHENDLDINVFQYSSVVPYTRGLEE